MNHEVWKHLENLGAYYENFARSKPSIWKPKAILLPHSPGELGGGAEQGCFSGLQHVSTFFSLQTPSHSSKILKIKTIENLGCLRMSRCMIDCPTISKTTTTNFHFPSFIFLPFSLDDKRIPMKCSEMSWTGKTENVMKKWKLLALNLLKDESACEDLCWRMQARSPLCPSACKWFNQSKNPKMDKTNLLF